MAIRNGDQVKFTDEKGEVTGKVLTIPRGGPDKGKAYISVSGLKLGVWIDVGRLVKI